MTKTIKVRAHHLLCLQGFQGYGYSPEFVTNMKHLVEQIYDKPKTTILELTTELDDFCSQCPHAGQNECQKDQTANARMQKMDLALLDSLSLKNPTKDLAENLINLSNQKLKTTNDVKDICGQCEWQKNCLWHQRLKKS